MIAYRIDMRDNSLKSADWIRDAVFYEIYPNSFYDANGDGYGDFKGIVEKLGYIEDLGCNAIWLNPCFDSPFMDGGYDVRDFCKVSKRFGTEKDFDDLLDNAHSRGIKVVLDLVGGHASEQNPLFLKSAKPKRNEFSDMFVWTKDPWKTFGTYRYEYGRQQRFGSYMVNFFSFQPTINYGFREVAEPEWQMYYKDEACLRNREWLISVIKFWLKRGCDGFRVDMADFMVKNDEGRIANIEFWQDVIGKVKREYPECVFISEWSNPEQALTAGFDIDFYLDRQGNGYHSLLRSVSNGSNNAFFGKEGKGDISVFAYDYLRQFLPVKELGCMGIITGNHDTVRLSNWYDCHQLKLIYAMLLTFPGVPFLYYGDEIGLRYLDVDSVEGGFQRTGSRTPMQWDNSVNHGFSKCSRKKLFLPVDKAKDAPTVEAQLNDPDSLLSFTKRIIKLRRDNPEFRTMKLEFLYCESNKFPFVYKRGSHIIAINPTMYNQSCKLDLQGAVVESIGAVETADGRLNMSPLSLLILKSV